MDVKYEPYDEIVVMDRNFFASPEELARFASITSGGHATGLFWAEGMVFLYFSLPTTTETTVKALVENKRVYWPFIGYTVMQDYKLIVETKEKIMVPVINMASNDKFRKVAEWLKNQCYPKDKPQNLPEACVK